MSENETERTGPGLMQNLAKLLPTAMVLISLGSTAGSLYLVYMSTLGYIPPTVTEDEIYDEYVEMRYSNPKDPAVMDLEPFTVNLAGEPKRSIRLQVSLHMINEDGYYEVSELDAEARDSIVRLLSGKTFEDIETIQGKLFLKQQIAANLNSRLTTGVIKSVYFNEFLVQ